MRRLRRDLSLAALTGRDISHALCYVVKDRVYHFGLWARRRFA